MVTRRRKGAPWGRGEQEHPAVRAVRNAPSRRSAQEPAVLRYDVPDEGLAHGGPPGDDRRRWRRLQSPSRADPTPDPASPARMRQHLVRHRYPLREDQTVRQPVRLAPLPHPGMAPPHPFSRRHRVTPAGDGNPRCLARPRPALYPRQMRQARGTVTGRQEVHARRARPVDSHPARAPPRTPGLRPSLHPGSPFSAGWRKIRPGDPRVFARHVPPGPAVA
ncbi:hypothetical protein OV450_6402 [Actinobacteria bacterium OV450]|nr:hypothetical protein OV450_6402 [Actinobacteria bacterium OV450]